MFTLYHLPDGEIFLGTNSICDYNYMKVAMERIEYDCKLGRD